MRLLALLVLIASTMAFAASGVVGSASGSVFGDWKTPTDSIVRVAPCGADVCLTVVKLSPNPPETTDQKNPDASLRSRSVCGLVVGAGFHETEPGHLDGGSLYDPKSGHTYRGTIVTEGDTLRLHGYIGVALFGRTEIWQRVPAVVACR